MLVKLKNYKKAFKPAFGRFLHLTAVAGCALGVSLLSAQSVNSQNVRFQSSPEVSGETCTIELLQEGTLGASPNSRVLNSQRANGAGAQIRVTSRKRLAGDAPGARFRITLEPPTTFVSAPPDGDTDVSFRARFSGTSVNNGVDFGIRNGTNARRLPRTGTSVTLVTGHLRARKDIGVFPGGDYRAVAVFRCE